MRSPTLRVACGRGALIAMAVCAGGIALSAPAAQSATLPYQDPTQPVPARVAIEDGRPVRITTDRRGFAGGSVISRAGPWCTSGHWWEEQSRARVNGPGASGVRSQRGNWNRDEWDVALTDGAVYRIFRDGDAGGWFIDAIVD